MSNQKDNSYLKEITSVLGAIKRLTTYTVLLYNDDPMDIVSQLLGNRSIAITEGSYGKVLQKKVGEQTKKLQKSLEK